MTTNKNLIDRLQKAADHNKGIRLTADECKDLTQILIEYHNKHPTHYCFLFEHADSNRQWKILIFEEYHNGHRLLIHMDEYDDNYENATDQIRSILNETDPVYWYILQDFNVLNNIDLEELPNKPITKLNRYYMKRLKPHKIGEPL